MAKKMSKKGSATRNSKRRPAYKKEKKSFLSAIVVVSAIVIFCGFMGFKAYELSVTKAALVQDISDLNNKIETEQARTDELKEFEVYTHTKKYAEEVAKDVLGYVYEDEIIFKPDN